MTRHKHAHTGLVTPPLPQLLLTAVLRLLAMLASNIASTLRMILRRPLVNAARAMPQALPEETSDIQSKETIWDRALTRPTRHSARSADIYTARHDDHRIIITSGSGPLVRVPGEGRGPAITSHLVPPRSFKAEQASTAALDPGLRRGCGRASATTNKNAAA